MGEKSAFESFKEVASIKFETSFINYDSGVQIKDDIWTDPTGITEGPAPMWRTNISEIRSDGVLISMPRNACATGNHIGLTVRALPKNGTPIDVVLTGRAVLDAFRDANASRDDVFLEISDLKQSGFEKFLEIYSQRQKSVFNLFESLKE